MKTKRLYQWIAPRGVVKYERIIVAGVALLLYTGLISGIVPDSSGASEKAALAAKVRELNIAVQVHEIFAGSFDEVKDPIEALDELRNAGRGGEYIDFRLSGKMQERGEAISGAPRVIWNPYKDRFEVAYGVIAGIKSFYHDEAKSEPVHVAEMRRRAALNDQDDNEWMWDTSDTRLPLIAGVGR